MMLSERSSRWICLKYALETSEHDESSDCMCSTDRIDHLDLVEMLHQTPMSAEERNLGLFPMTSPVI